MEGTTIGRADTESGFPTEDDLETRFVELFKNTSGMPLVWCAGQNIDRIVTVFRACKKSGRQLIVDLYVAHILRATGNPNIPQAEWDSMRVFVPFYQRRRIKQAGTFDLLDVYRASRIYPEQLAGAASQSVMLFRPSMMRDAEDAGCLEGAKLVYSMWSGYLERDETKPLLAWLEQHGILMEEVHTSGHAPVADLRRLRRAFGEAVVVPIHSEHVARFSDYFDHVAHKHDGDWWDVSGS